MGFCPVGFFLWGFVSVGFCPVGFSPYTIWSHVQDLGLVTDYNDNNAVKKTIRMLMSLAFLPRPLVSPNFLIIEGSKTVLNSDKLQTLCNYFKKTWLNGPFDIGLWNVNQETLRTNNLVEGWHNRLNRSVGKHHPNLYELITNLRNSLTQN